MEYEIRITGQRSSMVWYDCYKIGKIKRIAWKTGGPFKQKANET